MFGAIYRTKSSSPPHELAINYSERPQFIHKQLLYTLYMFTSTQLWIATEQSREVCRSYRRTGDHPVNFGWKPTRDGKRWRCWKTARGSSKSSRTPHKSILCSLSLTSTCLYFSTVSKWKKRSFHILTCSVFLFSIFKQNWPFHEQHFRSFLLQLHSNSTHLRNSVAVQFSWLLFLNRHRLCVVLWSTGK